MLPRSDTFQLPALTVELLRNKRWLLGESLRVGSELWRRILTVDEEVQNLHIDRMLHLFVKAASRVRNRARARPTLEEWETSVNVCCVFAFHMRALRSDTCHTPDELQERLTQFMEGPSPRFPRWQPNN